MAKQLNIMMNKQELFKTGFVDKSYKMGTNPLTKGHVPVKICMDEFYNKLPLVIQVLYTESSPHTYKF